MRRLHERPAAAVLSLLVATAMSCHATSAKAETSPFPKFDIDAACHEIANYAFAATLGQADNEKEFALCMDHERAAQPLALSAWTASPSRVRGECAELARGRYTALGRCLEVSAPRRSVP